MKSPIRYLDSHTASLKHLKSIISKGSITHSYLFFSGEVEFSLSESQRFICAHTDNEAIYEFWDCALNDSGLLYEIVKAKQFSDMFNKRIFHILQDHWLAYKDPYVRSALFFILNKLSDTGKISSGNFNESALNPLSLARLKTFKTKNFHLQIDKNKDLISACKEQKNADFYLFPMGQFNYSFFEHGKNVGPEETTLAHKQLGQEIIEITDKKWILLYKKHKEVFNIYKEQRIVMIDKFGKLTKQPPQCEEIIVTNF
jgi:site-specific DNA-adenine methylase